MLDIFHNIWKCETVYILGGGPSLIGMDLCLPPKNNRYGLEAYLYNKKCIGVNESALIGDWVDILWFGDHSWWNQNRNRIRHFKGLIFDCATRVLDGSNHLLRSDKKEKGNGIDEDPRFVCRNGSSGGSAINFAYHLGARKVILIGFDMKEYGEGKMRQTNWYPRKNKQHPNTMIRFKQSFSAIKKDADKLNLEILNATPGSAINCFKKIRLEDI